MPYEALARSGRIRREAISPAEVERALERARRDLSTARRVLGEDWDWGFAIAYNAVLRASRAYMFSQGYRPASGESHKNVFLFMSEALGGEYDDLVTYFDMMRTKRHRAIYDVAGIITQTEAKNLFEKATEFVKMVEKKIA